MSIHLDLPDADYRARPALSYSGAKSLMRSPAVFAHELEHPRPPKREYDRGHAAHRLVLGAGADLAVALDEHGEPFTSWSKNAAKAFAADARAAGQVPLLQSQFDEAQAMADAVRSHPLAGKLLEPGRFHPEVSVFWTDDETGTQQRARLDALIVDGDDGRPETVDLKTCKDVTRRALSKAIAEYRYHWQDPHYTTGLNAHGVEDVRFRFVFVEVDPPHLIRVVELDGEAWHTGRRFMAEARRRYAHHLRSGTWPGFPEQTEVIGLPPYSPTHPEDVIL